MTSENIGVDEAQRLVSEIVGEFAWFVRSGESRILRLEFGVPHLTVHAPQKKTGSVETHRLLRRRIVLPSGRWSLFVEDGLWTVETDGMKCGRDDVDPVKTMSCLEDLSGQKLESVHICRDTKTLSMRFDLGGVLDIQSHSEFAENSSWILFRVDGSSLSHSPGGVFEFDRA